MFTGALERLRVRLLDEPCAAQLLGTGAATASALEVTRTQPEQRELAAAHRARRSRSARAACMCCPHRCRASSPARPPRPTAAALAREPLLESLSTRMKTRVGLRAIDGLRRHAGAVRRRRGHRRRPRRRDDRRMAAAARRRAKCWCCRAMRRVRTRVLIHWTDEAARRATLAVSASLLRHVPAEAVYLGIVPESRARRRPRRADARAARCALRSATDAWTRDAHGACDRRDRDRAHAQPVHGQRADAGARHHRHHRRPAVPIAACWPRSPAGRCSSSIAGGSALRRAARIAA